MDKIEEAKKILKEQNQSHIDITNEQIADQVLNIDFEQLNCLYNNVDTDLEFNDLKPVKAINPDKLTKEEINKYIKNGEKKIREGKFAVTIMAGGQGTRLGHYGPKGTFKVTINNNEKYLFEIIIEKLLEAKEKYNVIIPCYIMTSSENHGETICFLKRKELFWISRKLHKMFHTR